MASKRGRYPRRIRVRDIQDKAIVLLSTTTVATNADAHTVLYTVPAGKVMIPAFAYFIAAGYQGATTSASIGQNTAEGDFVPITVLGAIDAANDVAKLEPIMADPAAKIEAYTAGLVIEMSIATQSGVAGNTVKLFGFLYNA